MINFILKTHNKNIEKSLNKYSKILENDTNLKICIEYDNMKLTSKVDTLHNREFIFKPPIVSHRQVNFTLNRNINAYFVSYTGIYKTQIKLVEKFSEENINYYKGIINSNLKNDQRRKYYRLPIDIDLKYTILPSMKSEFEGKTIDLSIGGMFMESDYNICIGKNIQVQFFISDTLFDIKGTILRKSSDSNTNKYLYHIKFDNIKSAQKDFLLSFILENNHSK